MKVTTKGQVTIPQHIRRHLGVEPHAEVEFRIQDGEVVIVKVASKDSEKGGKSKLEAYRGARSQGLSTKEWMEATRG